MSFAAELRNAHKERLRKLAKAAARINPKTDKELYEVLKAVEEPKPVDAEPVVEPEPSKPEQSLDQWAREQIIRNARLWAEVIYGLTTTLEGQPTINAIQLATCDVYGVKRKDLLSASRTPNIVLPRHVSMYLAKEMTCLLNLQIARATGRMDHTTVIHAFRKIERLLADGDETLRVNIERIKTLVGV